MDHGHNNFHYVHPHSSLWKGEGLLTDNNCKKIRYYMTVTEKMADHVVKAKPDHMSRSVYIEHMFWKGVHHTQQRASDS